LASYRCFVEETNPDPYIIWRDRIVGNHDTPQEFQRWCDFHFIHSAHLIEGNPYNSMNILDEEYAKLVKGAMVNTSIGVVWAPHDETMHTKIDDDSFSNVMWTYLQGYMKKLLSEETPDSILRDPSRRAMSEVVRKVKDQMKYVWSDALNYGISNEVFMVEVQVMHRLSLDRALKLPENRLENSIRFMRRDAMLKYQFASCVGKRMLCERVIARGRTSIIEHHRSVSWAEREYKALYTLVTDKKSYIHQALCEDYADNQKRVSEIIRRPT
jgi:hypothetical protein